MFGDGEGKGGALAGHAERADSAAVPFDDAAHIGQPDAGSLEVLHPVQALEHAEQLVRIVHAEAHAIVGDMEAADKVQLVLPETGICETDLVEGVPCCGSSTAAQPASKTIATTTIMSCIDFIIGHPP